MKTTRKKGRSGGKPTGFGMIMKPLDLDELLFDPPHLGVPHGANAFGQAALPAGGYVRIYLRAADGQARDAGFLTDMGPVGLACGSLVCDALYGAPLSRASALRVSALLARCPGLGPKRGRIMSYCLLAARRAATMAELETADDGR